MEASEQVEAYIDKHGENWKGPILCHLRSILLRTDAEECVKWGAPTYANRGNVFSFAAFKNHVALWFYEGVFLRDEAGVLITSDGKAKGLRQWRFFEGDEVNEELVFEYAMEAIENMKAGKKLPPTRVSDAVELHPLFQKALDEDERAKENFEALTLGQRNEYANHIGSAKREATVLKRIETSLDYIRKGLDLNHKYRK